MEQYTVKEFQSDFDNLIARVENGESFQINYEGKSVMIIPVKEYQEAVETITEATSKDWDDFWYNEDTLCDI